MNPIDPALAQAIAENPDDEGAWVVLEDWLITQGDPRARLAELQRIEFHAGLDEARHQLAPALLGPNHARLERVLRTSPWRGGFLRRAHLFGHPYEMASLVAALLASPAAQFLSELHIAEAVNFEILSTIARAPLLRELRVRAADPVNRSAVPVVADLDHLAPLIRLQSLHIENAEALAGGHAHVRFLNVSTRRPVALSALAANLPALTSFDLACRELEPETAPIEAWPALWHLGMQVDTCEPDPLATVIRSGLITQLDRLRICDGEPDTVPPAHGTWPRRRAAVELVGPRKELLRGGALARIEKVYLAPPLVSSE